MRWDTESVGCLSGNWKAGREFGGCSVPQRKVDGLGVSFSEKRISSEDFSRRWGVGGVVSIMPGGVSRNCMGKCFQSHIQKVAWAVSVAESSIPSPYPSALSSVLYYTSKVLELPESGAGTEGP